MHHARTRRLAWTFACIVAFAPLAACSSAAEQIAEDAAEAAGGDVEIDVDEGTVTFEDENGSGSFSSGTELPDSWPDDVPLPADHTVVSATEFSAEGEQAGLTIALVLEVDGDLEPAFADYADDLESSGFTISARGDSGGLFLLAERDGQTLNVTGDDGAGQLSVTFVDG
jgi:hypothetical protein